MVKVLADEAIRLGIPFLDHATGMSLIKTGSGAQERVAGLVVLDRSSAANPYGLSVVWSPSVVLASGGPGELYRDSVYPKNCFGSLGLALQAGLEVSNLTEHQFGIGTRRTEFPWNLSGTYVQVMPYVFSTDAQGQEYNFLADYYRTTQELVSNVFRKGYQWPFHASRTLDYGSSLVDLAIFEETRKGRTVWLDFNRNPQPVPGDLPFDLGRLDPDVRTYLENNQALQPTPIERLRCMNPLAIELYKQYHRDITRDPLPFNVNHQHMNGGVEVDIYARSSLSGCYAVGEIAGTHGVTRPGGAALNAGQVFGQRCAAHIHAQLALTADAQPLGDAFDAAVLQALGWLQRNVGNGTGIALEDLEREVQDRMSDKAGFVCHVNEVAPALQAARALNQRIAQQGVHIAEARRLSEGLLRVQMALLSEAVLTALDFYIGQGGGSRGARMLCDTRGPQQPQARQANLQAYRFLAEQEQRRREKIILRYDPALGMQISVREVREMEDTGKIYFEKNWAAYLTGEIYR
jgi:succinate dehydrogenase/fumarate reductase flavoprotein subunit